jgi:hypothetical protein
MSPRPFTVDEAVMSAIRPMNTSDVGDVARLHHAAMGSSTWAQLGQRFLRKLYRALLDDERFLAWVYADEEGVRGFIAGSEDTDEMMSATFRRAWLGLGLAAIPRVFNPALALKLLQTQSYQDVSGGVSMPESLFCSFEPALRGKRISGHINKVLFDELLTRGHKAVKVTTELDNEGANRQLTSWGFAADGHFSFYGKEMVRYVLDLESSPRVEAVSRR